MSDPRHPAIPVIPAEAARPVAFVSADTLALLLDCSVSTVREYERRGYLPRPVRIGGPGGLVRWKWSEVESMLAEMVPERDPILAASRGRA